MWRLDDKWVVCGVLAPAGESVLLEHTIASAISREILSARIPT